MKTEDLAQFDDSLTLRYTRVFPHPIDLVWEAVTNEEHVETWLLPVTRIERKLGGKFSFSWGSPEGTEGSSAGTIDVFDPPNTIRFTEADGSYLAFELSQQGDGTRLDFVQHFAPGSSLGDQEWPGGDQPCGPESPWRPGFMAGFHQFLDVLGDFLDGTWTRAQAQSFIDAAHNGETLTSVPHEQPDRQAELIERYRAHARETCPHIAD